jgi:hypothetical protein
VTVLRRKVRYENEKSPAPDTRSDVGLFEYLGSVAQASLDTVKSFVNLSEALAQFQQENGPLRKIV